MRKTFLTYAELYDENGQLKQQLAAMQALLREAMAYLKDTQNSAIHPITREILNRMIETFLAKYGQATTGLINPDDSTPAESSARPGDREMGQSEDARGL